MDNINFSLVNIRTNQKSLATALTSSKLQDINHDQSLFKQYPAIKSFLAGSLSGTISTVLFQPLDLVKTRLQNPSTRAIYSRNGGMVTVFTSIVQEEQIRGLWKGMVPSITRCVPGVGLYFCSLDVLKNSFQGDKAAPSALKSLLMGMSARCMTSVLLIPITVVKTRFESGVYSYSGVGSALQHIYKTEGFRGMTCGLVPTLFRDAPFSGLYLMFYTQAKGFILKDSVKHGNSSPIYFTCGVIAGILASFVTQPADVLKTKLQLYPKKFNGMWSVTVYIYDRYGIAGYFKGMVPRMLRRTLMASMAWTIYERLTVSIGLK